MNDAELAKQIESNYINEYRPMHNYMGVVFDEDSVLTEVSSNFPTTWFNGVLRADGSSPTLPERMEKTIAKYVNRDMMSWRLGVLTVEAETVRKLLESAAPACVNRTKAMVLRTPIESESINDKFKVVKVDNVKRMSEFMVPFNEPYCPNEEISVFLESYFGSRLNSQKESYLLGYYKEQPVSCAYYFVDSGVGMINGVSTISEFRGRGFARRIMEAAIDDIFRKHSVPVSLYARDMAVSMYEKIGFAEVYQREDYVFE